MEKKKMFLFFALFLLAAVLISCGKVAENKSEVEVVANNPLSQDQLNSAKALDAKLATLESRAEAKQILKDVIGTVSVSFKDDNKVSAMSDSGFDSLLDALADKEIAVRGHGFLTSAMGHPKG